MFQFGQQAADFSVFSFIQDDFQNGGLFQASAASNPFRPGPAFRKPHSNCELSEDVRAGVSRHHHFVDFLDTEPWVGQALGQGAVIGDDHQAFTLFVESSHREHSLAGWDQVDYASAAARIPVRRKNASRLVDEEIFLATNLDSFSVNKDLLLTGIYLGSKLDDRFSINFDTPICNQGFTVPATS